MKINGFPDAIVFDLDGTLLEQGALTRGIDVLKAEWLAVTTGQFIDMTYEGLRSIKTTFTDANLNTLGIKQSLMNAIAKPSADIEPMVGMLKRMDVKVGLLSNNSRRWGERVMRYQSLGEFDATAFKEDHNGTSSPQPYALLNMVNKFYPDNQTSDKRTIWFVGDSANNIRAAMNADLHTGSDTSIIPVAVGEKSTAHAYLNSVQALGYSRGHAYLSMNDLALFVGVQNMKAQMGHDKEAEAPNGFHQNGQESVNVTRAPS